MLRSLLDRLQPQPRPPEGEVVLLLFNTLARQGRFWGNTQLSLLSGELHRRGIANRQWVLLMRPDDEARNEATVQAFLAEMRQRRPPFVVLWATWLPWLPDALREQSGARVLGLDPAQPGDIPDGLRGLDSFSAVLATAAGATNRLQAARVVGREDAVERFNPRFDYHFLGADEPVVQDMAFVAIKACPFAPRIEDNPLYQGLDLGREVADRGCAYCNAAGDYRPLGEEDKRRQLTHQVRVLQRALPDLTEIAIPFPEDYLRALTELVRDADELELRPVTFSGQFNAEAVSAQEAALGELLAEVAGGEFRFHIGVVGLESFSDDDLARYNRGREADVREALAVLRRLREEHDPAGFMPATVGSFILFHPWQTPANLRHSVDAMRAERVDALFDAINVNDVRFHPGVAMYHLARRDGWLREGPPDEVHDVPLGGYYAERPWRFADDGARAVHGLFRALQHQTSQRVGLLDVALRAVEQGGAPEPQVARRGLERLARLVAAHERPAGARRLLALAGERNVGYPLELDAGLPRLDELDEGLRRLARDGGAAGARVTLLGPEPTMRKDLPAWIEAVRGQGAARVEVLTHGRMLAYPRVARGLAAAGVDPLIVLLHGADAAGHDAAVRVPGAFEQATEGVRALAPGRDRGSPAEVATVVTRDNRAALIALAETVRGLGVQRWRLLLPWAALDLAELDATADAVEAALDHARGLGLMAGLDRALSYHYALEMPEGER